MGNVIKLVKNKYKDEEPIQKLLSLIENDFVRVNNFCLLYTSPSPRDGLLSRMPSSA